MGSRKKYLTEQIVDICARLDKKGFVANHDGNVSARFNNFLLATPTSESKAIITPEMIITLDMDGKKVEGLGNSFSEIKLHLAAYMARENAMAVVHAHPPYLTARGLCGMHLEHAIPEAVISIGNIVPVTPFAMPGTSENNEFVKSALQIADVFMMPGNGVLAIGADVEQAYLRIELAEHIAKIYSYLQTQGAGSALQLSAQDMNTLLQKRVSLGLGPQGPQRPRGVQTTPHYETLAGARSENSNNEQLKQLISEELRKILS